MASDISAVVESSPPTHTDRLGEAEPAFRRDKANHSGAFEWAGQGRRIARFMRTHPFIATHHMHVVGFG